MSKKKKRRAVMEDENELYMVDVYGWEICYSFHVNNAPMKLLTPGDYYEAPTITLLGKIVWPALKDNITQAKVDITGVPKLNDHWKQKVMDPQQRYNGSMIFEKTDNTLHIMCSVPSYSIPFISVAAASEKIKHLSVWGTKLKRGEGCILRLNLGTRLQD